MTPAQLPAQLLEASPRAVAELNRGEAGHITFTELYVDSDRSCFVNLQAKLRSKSGSTIEVRRAEDGGFHILVPSDIKYVPGELKPPGSWKLEPVSSIAIVKAAK